MIINCPECKNQISDKASNCPKCGCPSSEWNNSAPTIVKAVKTANTKPKREHMKLPNGFGSIKKLGGTRRKPYAAYPPLRMSDYDENGNKPKQKAIGYYETWYDAYDCLSKYHQNGGFGKTFKDVYDDWYKTKFNNPLKPMSKSREDLYAWAYSFCEPLYSMPMSTVVKSDMQNVMNKAFVEAPSSAEMLNTLFSQLYKYALSEGIVSTDYARHVDIPKYEVEHGDPLTDDEISRLWEHTNEKHVRTALILAYTGLRIEELEICTIDLDNKVLIGGNKTEAGKNKVVPISPLIFDFVKDFDQAKYNHNSWRKTGWGKVVSVCNLDTENKKCTPHSLRHTFSYLWDRDVGASTDELAKHLVMGHKFKGDDVEVSTYGHRTIEQLRTYVEMIKKEPNQTEKDA